QLLAPFLRGHRYFMSGVSRAIWASLCCAALALCTVAGCGRADLPLYAGEGMSGSGGKLLPSKCGDGVCDAGETMNCPADCSSNPGYCGDAVCAPGAEDQYSCPSDCGDIVCGDTICMAGEEGWCEDCTCNNGVCEDADFKLCPWECNVNTCGNSVC